MQGIGRTLWSSAARASGVMAIAALEASWRFNVQTLWRLALMFDAPGNDLVVLEQSLVKAGDSIRKVALGNPVRMGIADRHLDLGEWALRNADKGWADVDGAIEITTPAQPGDVVAGICRNLRPIMASFCDLASVAVMTGPVFSMVPVRTGRTFLSLAFRRDPALTSAEFRKWWYDHHSGVAILVLGEDLLAYDQVHVEQQQSIEAARAFGSDYTTYDAYDNLTWADRYSYLHSISDEDAMVPVYADEVGRIDPASRRSAIMTEIH